MFFFSKSSSTLGIDIGTSSIKAVQLKKENDKFILESYGLVNVYYPADSAAKIDVVAQTANVLRTLYERSRFSCKRIIMSLPSNLAFVSILNFPPMSEKEIQKSVEYQAKKYIPLPMSDVNLGWQLLEEAQPPKTPSKLVTADDLAKMPVLLTAVPKTVINNYVSLAEQAGFEVVALEIESLSLIRSLIGEQDMSSILLVDIGAKSTILSVVHHGYLWATRHLSIGGDTITTSIAHSMGLSFERAEQMKRTSFQEGPASPAFGVTRNVIEIIKQEVQQIIRITENQGKKISKIILTGGGSKLPGLIEEFKNLSPKVETGNPFTQITRNPQVVDHLNDMAPQLAVSVGLAMRAK